MVNLYVLRSTLIGILGLAVMPEVLGSTGAPYFIKEPRDTYAQRGKSAVLDCLVGGNLKAAIAWRRNGIVLDLSQDDRRMIRPDGSLYFSKVNHNTTENSDEGIYQCEALTRNDMDLDFQILSRTARLVVAEISSKVAVTPSKLQVSFGDTSRFYCNVNDSTPKAVVRWRKLGENNFIESRGRFTTTSDGALQIAESSFNDQGDYECTAENTVTKTSYTSTITASLKVITDSEFPRGPTVSVTSDERRVIAGDIFILECIANGFPKPRVTWLLDGLPVVLGSGYSVVGENNLMIESVTEEQAGTYTCRAISRNGIKEASIKLEVHHPPVFIKKPNNVHAYSDSNALFECFADGIPKPVITWSRNGDVIEESYFNDIGDGYLLVKMLVLSDMGPYQCFAENYLGKIQATAELNVYMEGQPLPSIHTTTAPNAETPDSTPGSFAAGAESTTFGPVTTSTSDLSSKSHPTLVPKTTTTLDTEGTLNTAATPVTSATFHTTVTSATKQTLKTVSILKTTAASDRTTALDSITTEDTTTALDSESSQPTSSIRATTASPDDSTSTFHHSSVGESTTASGDKTAPYTSATLPATETSDATSAVTADTRPNLAASPTLGNNAKDPDTLTTLDPTTVTGTTDASGSATAKAAPDITSAAATDTTATPFTISTAESKVSISSTSTQDSKLTSKLASTSDNASVTNAVSSSDTSTSSDNFNPYTIETSVTTSAITPVTAVPGSTASTTVSNTAPISNTDAVVSISSIPDTTADSSEVAGIVPTTFPRSSAEFSDTTTTSAITTTVETKETRKITMVSDTSAIPHATTSVSDTKIAQNTASPSYTTAEPHMTTPLETSTNTDITLASETTTVPVTESISDISTAEVITATSDSTPASDSTVAVLMTVIQGISETPASTAMVDSTRASAPTDSTKHPYFSAAKDAAPTVEATTTKTVTVANQYATAVREVITTSDATEPPYNPTREITSFPDVTSDFTTPLLITTAPDVQHRDELPTIVREKTVREGSIKVIKCIATAIHKPDVDWYRNGKKLPTMKCSNLSDVRCQGIAYEVYEEPKERKFRGKNTRTIKVLKIRSAVYSRDQGKFECVATNGHAQPAKLIINLNVLAPPRLIQKPYKVLSGNGKGSKVSCVVNKGNPLPTFKWEYQNMDCFTLNTSACEPVESQWMPVPESLLMSPPNLPIKKSVVKVQSNQPTASFRCLASNKLGSDFHIIKLVRSEPLAFVKKPQNILKGYLGKEILINCSTNDQDATVSLFYRRHPFVAFAELKPEEKKLLKKGQAFELLNVGLRDAGFYICEAKNEANDKIRWPPGTGYLIINEEPLEFLDQSPVIIRGYLSQNVVINCSTNDREATVSLLYKQHPLASFHELNLRENKLLRKGKVFTLLNVERRDAGIYSCQASNRGGWNIRWPHGRGYLIPIRGGLPNHFVLRPKTAVTVRQGQQVTITCESEGVSETKLQWVKQTNKEDVSVPSNLVTVDKDRSTNQVRAILKISNVQPEDAGVYKCVLRVFDKTDHKMTSLHVREPLTFLVKPNVILHGYQGRRLMINCSTNDRNATASLYYRRHPLAPFRERKIDAKKLMLKGQVFTLLNLSQKDQGLYACEAKTEENEIIRWPSGRGYLIVSQARLPDYFELEPANPIKVSTGGSTNVTCESEGVSVTQLQWKKGDISNGGASVQDRMVSIVKDKSTNRVQAVLRITNAQMEDSGVYQCVLRVFEKTNMKSVEITVSNN
ncbi:hemicentin-1-like isoform X1 [Stylophora pistillata]|uniref:hemicentin-1-like isoform X1 n=1 Tax=Stylophora pistillata TaxID=50429 RepID=UPI000C0527D5|nr:hemicentin-1-like isoform X1 [Stylophora pistillata]